MYATAIIPLIIRHALALPETIWRRCEFTTSTGTMSLGSADGTGMWIQGVGRHIIFSVNIICAMFRLAYYFFVILFVLFLTIG
jgi:hypothetical protein